MKTNEVSFAKNVKETLNKPTLVIASVAKQSMTLIKSAGYGSPRPRGARADEFNQRFLNKLFVGLSIAAACFIGISPAAYASIAGHVQFVSGEVQITNPAGQIRPAQKGDAINEGDTLTSAQKSSAQIKMQDGGFVAVRPDTRLKFDQFVFAGKEDGSEKSFFSLFKGGFRAVTGLIGNLNKQNYKITTPAATIGIRGTDHETFLITPDSPLAQLAPAGAYNKVNVGETYVATDKGTIFVQPNQMGFAGGMDQMPKVQPINTKIFTVAEAATPEAKAEKKEEKEEKTEAKQEEKVAKGDKEEKKEEKKEEAKAETTQDTATGTQEETAPVRETAVVDATAPATGGAPAAAAPTVTTTTTVVAAPPPAPTTVINAAPVAGGSTANLTTGSVTTSTGQTVSVTEGLYATQAQAAADAALAAASAAQTAVAAAQTDDTALAAMTLVDVVPATTAITTATTEIANADTAVVTATALIPPDATANMTSAQAAADAAATQAADAALAANGAFADSTAVTANNTVQSAKDAALNANTAVQNAAATVTTQNTALTTAQSAATTALGSASTSLTTADNNLIAANTQNTAITTAQSAITTQVTDAQTAAANAQVAAIHAQLAADEAAIFQAAGDLTNAQAQLLIAQQELAYAQQQLTLAQAAQTSVSSQLVAAQAAQTAASTAVTTAVQAANLAFDAAITASAQADAAQTAFTAADTELAFTDPAPVNTQLTIIAANAPIAAYNNPAVVTANRFIGVLKTVVAPAAGQYIEGGGPGDAFAGVGTANTSFVLDGAGNLVESRHTWYEESAASTATTQVLVTDANVKRTGGTAAETFKLPDNSIYGGRWTGGSITVTDNATAVPTFTRNFGATSEHWGITLAPPAGYVQALTGTTTYTKVAATSPTDALGTVGTLTSATLAANFTSMVVDAALNLTIAAKTLDVAAANMVINGSFFSTGTQVTATCSGCAGTYYANVGGMFAGDAAASAGLSYTLWTGAAPGATTGATDLIQGVTALSAGTAPVVTAYDTQAQAAADAAAAAATAAQTAATAAAATNTTLTGIAPVDTAPATVAIGTATTDVGTATTAVSAATALTPADAIAAANNATAAAATAADAAALAVAAQNALSLNGTFADATAAPANTTVQSANTTAQTAKAAVESNATAVVTQNSALSTAQAAASTALGTANTDLATADVNLITANDQNTLIAAAQSSAALELTAAQTAAANAQAAADAAQAAATQAAALQVSGDFAGAEAQLIIAQQELAYAQQQPALAQAAQTAVSSQLAAAQAAQTAASTAVTTAEQAANLAFNAAITASAQADAAQTAFTAADTALALTDPTPVSTQAAIVAANAPVAAYNNPAVAGDFIAAAMFPVAVGGGFNEAFAPNQPPHANTTYVLDGSGNLVEARNIPFRVQANQNGTTLTPSIEGASGANIKWSGGTAADTFKLTDNSIYAGRWMNATVTVTDNTTPANIYTYTPVASLWAVLLPPPAGYVPALVGSTNYTMAGSTIPVDAFGNLGVLNSATLFADFTSQVVDAAIQLTMSAGPMAGTFNVSGTAMPIDAAGGFGVPNASALTTSCTVGTCIAGVGGYSADLGGSFAGTGAASAGMSYNIWPTTALSTDPASNSIQGLVAFNTTTAPSVATNPPAGTWSSFGHMLLGSTTAGWQRGRFNDGGVFALPESNFILDGAGNLVRSLHVDYNERFVSGTSSPSTNHYSDAMVTYSGGVASEHYANADMAIGRWTGGQMIIADNLGTLPTLVNDLGVTSSYWFMTKAVPVNYVQSLIGTTTYTQVGATLPTDSFGNIGTLPVATLSANFTNQTVDASVAFTIANQGLTIANPAIPIVAGTEIFEGVIELGTAPTVNCSGTGCVAGYEGWLTGGFAGATASSANLAYKIWPTASPDSLVSDLIQGVVAFNTGTAPTVNPAGPLAAYVATNTSVAYTGAYGGAFNFIAAPGDLTWAADGPTTFTENYGDGWGYRRDVLSGATTATPPITTPNGITFGVWENVTNVAATTEFVIAPDRGGSPSYMYGAEGYLDSAVVLFNGTTGNTGPLSGVFTYTSEAFTSFDKNSWATGSLTTQTLSANFTNQTVSVALAGTMGATSWTADSNNMPINFTNSANGTGSRFNGSPVVTVNTVSCAPNCGGYIDGAFVGQNYAGAIVQYNVWDNNNLNVDGVVAFSNDTPVGTGGTPTGVYVVANAGQQIVAGGPTTITTNGAGVLTGWGGIAWGATVTPASGSVAETPVGTGSGTINWGTWGDGSVLNHNFIYEPGYAQLHWITAPEPTPVYLAEVLTTTNTYNFVDGDVTNMFAVPGGVHGTISGATSLTANFTTQTIAMNLALTVNGQDWVASTPNALLEYSNGNTLNAFSADSYRSSSQPGYLTVTVDSDGAGTTYSPVAANGNVAGQLVGAALDGAILKFNLVGVPVASTEWVQGVAALGAAVPNDPATAYRAVLFSLSDPMAVVPTVYVGGSKNNAARAVTNGSGYLTQFDDNSGGGNGSTIQYASAGTGLGFVDQGSAVIGGDQVSWGRWDAGTVVNVTDRATGAVQTGIVLAGGAHALVGPLMTGPVALPVSGTYDYNMVGATIPTTDTGATGTLNSATLQANFTAQTVNVGVNVTAAGATLGATATNLPIQQRANFFAESVAGSLAVTCSGTCGTTTNRGAIGGGFGGAGGVLAGITYGFEKVGANAGTVNGVVAFQQGAVIP